MDDLPVCSHCLEHRSEEADALMLHCGDCGCFIHTGCVRVEDPPLTTIAGDNFFDLVCSDCTEEDSGYDKVKRSHMKVHVAILLALYNLHRTTPRPQQNGFYHWKEDIFDFINRHHHLLFSQEQQKHRIIPGSFSTTMTKYPQWIQSGSSCPVFKSRGYYRLRSVLPPPLLLRQQLEGTSGSGGFAGARNTKRKDSSRAGGSGRRPKKRRLIAKHKQQLLLGQQPDQAADAAGAGLSGSPLSSSRSSSCSSSTTLTHRAVATTHPTEVLDDEANLSDVDTSSSSDLSFSKQPRKNNIYHENSSDAAGFEGFVPKVRARLATADRVSGNAGTAKSEDVNFKKKIGGGKRKVNIGLRKERYIQKMKSAAEAAAAADVASDDNDSDVDSTTNISISPNKRDDGVVVPGGGVTCFGYLEESSPSLTQATNWYEKLPSAPPIDITNELIFSDDFLAVGHQEEVTGDTAEVQDIAIQQQGSDGSGGDGSDDAECDLNSNDDDIEVNVDQCSNSSGSILSPNSSAAMYFEPHLEQESEGSYSDDGEEEQEEEEESEVQDGGVSDSVKTNSGYPSPSSSYIASATPDICNSVVASNLITGMGYGDIETKPSVEELNRILLQDDLGLLTALDNAEGGISSHQANGGSNSSSTMAVADQSANVAPVQPQEPEAAAPGPKPYQRHPLALQFRKKMPVYEVDAQELDDLQYLESIEPKNIYEERKLLNKLNRLYQRDGPGVHHPQLYLLRRRLIVRKEQREHGIGTFNIHQEMQSLAEQGRLLTNEERVQNDHKAMFGHLGSALLDRFQKEEATYERQWDQSTPLAERLQGSDPRNARPIKSPYSQKWLPPYYFQLTDFKLPLKLRLNREIVAHWRLRKQIYEEGSVDPQGSASSAAEGGGSAGGAAVGSAEAVTAAVGVVNGNMAPSIGEVKLKDGVAKPEVSGGATFTTTPTTTTAAVVGVIRSNGNCDEVETGITESGISAVESAPVPGSSITAATTDDDGDTCMTPSVEGDSTMRTETAATAVSCEVDASAASAAHQTNDNTENTSPGGTQNELTNDRSNSPASQDTMTIKDGTSVDVSTVSMDTTVAADPNTNDAGTVTAADDNTNDVLSFPTTSAELVRFAVLINRTIAAASAAFDAVAVAESSSSSNSGVSPPDGASDPETEGELSLAGAQSKENADQKGLEQQTVSPSNERTGSSGSQLAASTSDVQTVSPLPQTDATDGTSMQIDAATDGTSMQIDAATDGTSMQIDAATDGTSTQIDAATDGTSTQSDGSTSQDQAAAVQAGTDVHGEVSKPLPVYPRLQRLAKRQLSRWLQAPMHYRPAHSQHIPQMNALARQFFWPGINLSEVLQYPELTCVALYRFQVVGFGVAVPDTGVCSEAYLSFLLVHPEWRRAGIASTILYCLSEEIKDSDITLHVSPTNAAMLLYQSFGFKCEEFVENFYDKYLPDDHHDSKHAFFMRRRRLL